MNDAIIAERPVVPSPFVQKPFPRIWPSIGWVVAFMVFQVVAGIGALVAAVAQDQSDREPAAIIQDLSAFALPMIWGLVIAEIILLLLLWLYLHKDDRRSAIQLDKWSDLTFARTVLIAVALIGAGLAFNWAYSEYVVPDIKVQEELRKLFAAIPSTLPNQILLFVAVAIIAPLLEELLFRGLLQKSLSHKIPIWAAITISAFVFGAIHMDFYAMPPLVMMGAIFGVIYHRTGSLRVTILLHVINNAAALALS
jgi:membrane protease YdiL (CAAX protease family)